MVSVRCTELELTFGNGDMLQQEDDSSHRKLTRHSRNEVAVDDGRAYMLEASRHVLQDSDGVSARRAPAVSAVQPGRDRQDDDYECVPEHRHEEEEAFCDGTISQSD